MFKKIMIGLMAAMGIMYAGGNIAPVAVVETPSVGFVPYFGGGVSYTFDEDKTYATAIGGLQYGKYVAVEARGNFGNNREAYGVYFKPILPLPYEVNVYGLMGYEKLYRNDSYQRYRKHCRKVDVNIKDNTSDWAAGGGVEYKGFFADALYNFGTKDTRGTVGYIYRF